MLPPYDPPERDNTLISKFTFDSTGSGPKMTEFEYSALESMIAVLCCGPFFNDAAQSEDVPLYHFLDSLLESRDQRVYSLAKETIVLLLEFNPDVSTLLDWVVDRFVYVSNQVNRDFFPTLKGRN